MFTYLLEQRITDTLCGTKVVMRYNYPKLMKARDDFGDVDRWGVFTIGTGFGNARFTNRKAE